MTNPDQVIDLSSITDSKRLEFYIGLVKQKHLSVEMILGSVPWYFDPKLINAPTNSDRFKFIKSVYETVEANENCREALMHFNLALANARDRLLLDLRVAVSIEAEREGAVKPHPDCPVCNTMGVRHE